MVVKRSLLVSVSVLAASLFTSVASASAEQWHFFVQNNTSSTMTGLFAAEPEQNWGQFDIGSGIAAGEGTKMIWSPSTNGQGCEQWLKATFADGSESTSEIFDFCQDLDDPIVFQ